MLSFKDFNKNCLVNSELRKLFGGLADKTNVERDGKSCEDFVDSCDKTTYCDGTSTKDGADAPT